MATERSRDMHPDTLDFLTIASKVRRPAPEHTHSIGVGEISRNLRTLDAAEVRRPRGHEGRRLTRAAFAERLGHSLV